MRHQHSGPAMASYAVLVLDADKVVRGSISFEQETDDKALGDAAAILDPGVAGELWEGGRLVGPVRGKDLQRLGG